FRVPPRSGEKPRDFPCRSRLLLFCLVVRNVVTGNSPATAVKFLCVPPNSCGERLLCASLYFYVLCTPFFTTCFPPKTGPKAFSSYHTVSSSALFGLRSRRHSLPLAFLIREDPTSAYP
ncbi:unnamed protein product, partial [Ectocarpus fasciculatus]